MKKLIHTLTLQQDMNNIHESVHIKQDSYLWFQIGHTLQGRSIRLFTNYPLTSNIFFRHKYNELAIINPTLSQNLYDSYDNYAELVINLSGAFQFFFTFDGSSSIANKAGEGYFIVDPRFTFTMSEVLKDIYFELDGIVLQTYLSKNLGPFNEWESRIQAALNGNYNMVHFTPLQELGYSRSAYSLRDQLKVNPDFSTSKCELSWEMIEKFVDNLYRNHQVLSMTDLVYNHSSNDSPWIHEHPECAYNVVNSPHLRTAYLLDRIVWNLTVDVAANKYEQQNLSNIITGFDQVEIIRSILWQQINDLKLHEFYMAHIENEKKKFREFLSNIERKNLDEKTCFKNAKIILDHQNYQRFNSSIDFSIAAFHFYRNHRDIDAACIKYGEMMEQLNKDKYQEIQSHLEAAVTNVIANINYRFIDEHGLKLQNVTIDTPLMWNYFYHPHADVVSLDDCEKKMEGEERIMAFNGCVMNDDPLSNFAEKNSNVYLRRELIVWGDSVKLRYGDGPEDCPYLWNHMLKYTELTANIFHGVRLDNCNGTPIHVAQAMLDRARAVRPNLYVIVDTFTSNENINNIFVNNLGINSRIVSVRNALNLIEQITLINQCGRNPVGGFAEQSIKPLHMSNTTPNIILYDLTQDTVSQISKRSPFDILPTAALVSMTCGSIGSFYNYELMPYCRNISEEKPMINNNNNNNNNDSIMQARSLFNKLHHHLSYQKYDQMLVEQITEEVIAVTRINSKNNRSVIMFTHTSFYYSEERSNHRDIKDIYLSGKVINILYEIRTIMNRTEIDNFKKENILSGIKTTVKDNILPFKSNMIRIEMDEESHYDRIHFVDFPPGSVVAIEIELTNENKESLIKINDFIKMAPKVLQQTESNKLSSFQPILNVDKLSILKDQLDYLEIVDFNRILYRTDDEENADFPDHRSYYVPNYGRLVFCGLEGIVTELIPIREHNDINHPICVNIRNENWIMDYISDRLELYGGRLKKISKWFRNIFACIKRLPRHMVLSMFDTVIVYVYNLTLEKCFAKLGINIVEGSSFMKNLALGSIMLCSPLYHIKSLPLYIKTYNEQCTISAGFPYFAKGYFRNWGRDTFVSLKGLTLLTSRYEEAKTIILMYASTVRHGLIPNLLADGFAARYNARDATWFWLNAIKEYESWEKKFNKSGRSILKMEVDRMYPMDQSDGNVIKKQLLCEVIQEILQRHADGINFTESRTDENLHEDGYTLNVGITRSNKFPFGGSKFNGGTWMNKIGTSDKTGNKGYPATPRDGSAVEIVGLCAAILKWLIKVTEKNKYPYPGVQFENNLLTWTEWYNTINQNFDQRFFIPLDCTEPGLSHNCGIYRDSVNSSLIYTDNQFRPNFLISMTVCPSIFNVENAWHALKLVEDELLGPLGLRTLSPRDLEYSGYYDEKNDSFDKKSALGFNYHQGPEWIFLTGFYLQAKLIFCEKIFATDKDKYIDVVKDTIAHVQQVLARLDNHIKRNKWRSLPNFTNKNGEYCPYSTTCQAWSIALTFEALDRLINFKHVVTITNNL